MDEQHGSERVLADVPDELEVLVGRERLGLERDARLLLALARDVALVRRRLDRAQRLRGAQLEIEDDVLVGTRGVLARVERVTILGDAVLALDRLGVLDRHVDTTPRRNREDASAEEATVDVLEETRVFDLPDDRLVDPARLVLLEDLARNFLAADLHLEARDRRSRRQREHVLPFELPRVRVVEGLLDLRLDDRVVDLDIDPMARHLHRKVRSRTRARNRPDDRRTRPRRMRPRRMRPRRMRPRRMDVDVDVRVRDVDEPIREGDVRRRHGEKSPDRHAEGQNGQSSRKHRESPGKGRDRISGLRSRLIGLMAHQTRNAASGSDFSPDCGKFAVRAES